LGNVPFEISHFDGSARLTMERESGKPGVKPLVRQKVESAGKIAQGGLVARPGSNGRHLSNG
jgi:hypothetical protein